MKITRRPRFYHADPLCFEGQKANMTAAQRNNFAHWKDIPFPFGCHPDVLWGPQNHLQPAHQTLWVAPSALHFLSFAPPAGKGIGCRRRDEKSWWRIAGGKWQSNIFSLNACRKSFYSMCVLAHQGDRGINIGRHKH